MLKTLSTLVANICQAEDKQQLDHALSQAASKLGFVSYNLSCGKKTTVEFMTAPDLTSWTQSDLIYYDRENWGDRDPLLNYAGNGKTPLEWHKHDWLQAGYGEYHEYLASSGIDGGITIPLSNSAGRYGALTLLALPGQMHPDRLAAASIIAHTTQARLAALGTLNALGKSAAQKYRDLTPRQREILHWAAMGKTNSEIGTIMGMTRRGIDYHMGEIRQKLGVATRMQAIFVHAQSNA